MYRGAYPILLYLSYRRFHWFLSAKFIHLPSCNTDKPFQYKGIDATYVHDFILEEKTDYSELTLYNY